MEVFLVREYVGGWKVVLNEKYMDSSRPVFHSHDGSDNGLEDCRRFCADNNLKILKEYQ